jgi:hypothetical protein
MLYVAFSSANAPRFDLYLHLSGAFSCFCYLSMIGICEEGGAAVSTVILNTGYSCILRLHLQGFIGVSIVQSGFSI